MAEKRQDVDREDIKAMIRKTGITCEALGLANGYHRSAVRCALMRPWPAVEAIIAKHLGRHPSLLWPSRYDIVGLPLRGRAVLPGKPPKATGRGQAKHRQKQAAA